MMRNRVEHQINLEELYSKNQLIPRIKKEFENCTTFDFKKYFAANGIPSEFGFAFMTQMALHKRASLETLIGILRHHCADSQECADLLLKCLTANLATFIEATKTFVVVATISEQVQQELDRFQYPLPMVIRPKKVEKNKDTGYMLGTGSIILKDNHHEDDVCLDHINRVNRIRFEINGDTATMIKNSWRNLDHPKQGESKLDFERRKKAFEKYDRTANDVIKLLTKEGNKFYLTHKYDKRGRVYCQGYHINYQGNPWNKAVLELADKEKME